MTLLLKGQNGTLRILDSAAILHGTSPRDDATPDIVTFDGSSTYANITTEAKTDDTNYANNILADNDDAVFIGSDIMFAMIRFLKDGASDYAAGSGTLKIYYFDGTDFSNQITDFDDGTDDGTDCFAQAGYIGFKIPKDWAIGAGTAVNANLDDDKFYVKLMTTSSSSTDVDVDVLCPCDGQYFDISFADMDFAGPFGRPLPEETLVMDRGNHDAKSHFVSKSDAKQHEPIPLSFACKIDDTYNKMDIKTVLACGNPSSSRWDATGTTSKGSTKNDGTNSNPAFANAAHKTVNVQIVWDNSSGYPVGSAYYEVFFIPSETSLTEAEDGITLSCAGGVYGIIEDIHGLGNRH